MITRVEDPLLSECPTSPEEGHGPKPRRWGSRTIWANLLMVLIPSALQSTDDITTRPCDANVGHGWRTNVLHAAVVISTGAEIAEQSFAATANNAMAFSLIADGDAAWLPDDLPDLLGRPARSFEDFAREHASAFSAKAN